jgi:uncharacterized protein YceK
VKRPEALLLALLGLSGCATVSTLDGAEAPSYPGLDLPGSALLDTLLLPLSVLTALGIGFNAQGGL